jgi:peptidoglycan/LPS O-acetylase OafA/YrhL
VTAVTARSSLAQPITDEIPSLFGLRALAALAVVTTHVGFQTGAAVSGPWAPALSRLDIGVTLFFLLSGFLLYRPWASRSLSGWGPPSTRTYAARRALRILPAYWLAVLGAALLVRGNGAATGWDWLVQVLLLQVYVDDSALQGLTQMWSLCVEVAFYALLPLLGWLAARGTAGSPSAWLLRQVVLLGLLSLTATAWQVWVRQATPDLPGDPLLWLPGHLDWFAAGMALAVATAWIRHGHPNRWSHELQSLAEAGWSMWGIAAAVFLIATTPLAGPLTFLDPATTSEALAKHWLYLLCAALILVPLVLAPTGGPAAAMGSRVPYWLGEISYGIFLWHLVVLDVVYQALGRAPFTGGFWPVWILSVTGSVVVAAASYLVVERPLMRWDHRQRSGASATTATATASPDRT